MMKITEIKALPRVQTRPPSRSKTRLNSQNNPSSSPKYSWTFNNRVKQEGRTPNKNKVHIEEIPLSEIRRPLQYVRVNDNDKVEALMASIQEIGLQEPIDVLEVNGKYYGFSGCHRFEAHKRLGIAKIKCNIIKATKSVLKMHLM